MTGNINKEVKCHLFDSDSFSVSERGLVSSVSGVLFLGTGPDEEDKST